jgi:tetratricopeptide (TPR) repeat protein
MGIFDFLFGAAAPEVHDPDELKQLLFQAIRSKDLRRLEKLCRANQGMIAEHFPRWQKVPDQMRGDRAALDGYMHALVTIAQCFAQRLGTAELMERLMGTEQTNPLARWQKSLQQAVKLIEELRFPEARDLLTNLLIDFRRSEGSGVDAYLPITLGRLGECYFQAGEAEKALPHLDQACRLCEENGDAEGVIAYLHNLYEVHRYLGQPEPAAVYNERLAAILEQQGRRTEAARARKQAQIVRAGEPLNRVIAVVNDTRCEIDDVEVGADQKVQFLFERNRVTLRPAETLTQRGEQLAGAGRYEEALGEFRAATQADPFDPHCRYLEGLTLLYLGRPVDAVESYQAAEERAPGWFHCRADLWLAQQMTLGTIDQPTFLALNVLEDGQASPKEKVRLAEEALARAPHLAALHLERGKNLVRLARSEEARTAFRQGLACASESDVRTRLLVELGVLVEEQGERVSLLREAATLKGNLVAAATATLALKAMGPPTRSEQRNPSAE